MDLNNSEAVICPSEGRRRDVWDWLLSGYFLVLVAVPLFAASFGQSVPSPALAQMPDIWRHLGSGLLFLLLAVMYFFTVARRSPTRWIVENSTKKGNDFARAEKYRHHCAFLSMPLLFGAIGPLFFGSAIPTLSNYFATAPVATLEYEFEGCKRTRLGMQCSVSGVDEDDGTYRIGGVTLSFLARTELTRGQRFMVTGELSPLGHRFEQYEVNNIPTWQDQDCVNGFREFRGKFFRCAPQEEASQ